MAQAFYCPACKTGFAPELRGRSCPACGEELIHGRIPAGRTAPLSGKRKAYTPFVSRAVWDHILKKDVCCYCASTRATTIDHITPKALGGAKGAWTNRTGSCFQCNQDKAHMPLLFFMLEQCGEDLSEFKTAEGRWPLPEIRPTEEAAPPHGDPNLEARRILAAPYVEAVNERRRARNRRRMRRR